MKVSVVNSAGASFCWNYVTDNYAADNVCWIYVDFEVELSVVIMQVTVSVAGRVLEYICRWQFLWQICG